MEKYFEDIKSILLWVSDFSQTPFGMFVIQVLCVFILSEVIRVVAKEILRELVKLPARKEKLLYLLIGLISNSSLGMIAAILINWGHGFRKIVLVSFLFISASLALHYSYMEWKEKKKNIEKHNK